MRYKAVCVTVMVLGALLVSAAVGIALAQGRATQQSAAPLGSGFTYQGQLKRGSTAFGDACSLAFHLYDDAAVGLELGGGVTTTAAVTNGLFTVWLNGGGEFGPNAFNGGARWLDISVKCSGDPGFVKLAPRQAIGAAPYALYALSAGTAATATFASSVNTSSVQARVFGSCAVGSSVRAIYTDGTVACDVPATVYAPLYQPITLDLSLADGGLKGFAGAFTDGRYGYLVPNVNVFPSGKIARVDLSNFGVANVLTLDLTLIDSGLKGFSGGFTDGHYGYFVPDANGLGTSGKVARVDLANFTASGVVTLDLKLINSALSGFQGGFTDGNFGYFVPYVSNGIYVGTVARVDLHNFAPGGVVMLDLTLVDGGLKGFQGGFTDGRYAYFVPYATAAGYAGKVARVDLKNFNTGGVSVLDLTLVDGGLKGFDGGFTDGRYGYFVPYFNGAYSGKAARVDLANFTAGGVVTLDLSLIDSRLKGFFGGFTDGQYAYYVPNYDGIANRGLVARVDLNNFTAGGVSSIDLTLTDSRLRGFWGGFTDGRYAYFVPHNDGVPTSRLARIQLLFGGVSP